MLALAFMMTLVGMFLSRLVGRDESLRHNIKHMYSDMSPEDKQNFDRMVREYRDKWYPENKR